MFAIEFNTKVCNGKINIPAQFHDDFISDVKVILLRLDEISSNQSYDSLMKEAGRDKSFLLRTINCAEDFEAVDSEVSGEW